jgi:hypothetical protein
MVSLSRQTFERAAVKLIVANPDVEICFVGGGNLKLNYGVVKEFCKQMFKPIEKTTECINRSNESPFRSTT